MTQPQLQRPKPIIVFLSSRRSRRHQPRLKRSPEEAARASRRFASARVKHTRLRRPPEPPRIPATRRRLRPTFAGAAVTDHRPFAAEKLPPRRRLAASPPSPPLIFPVSRRVAAASPPVTDTGDSPVTRQLDRVNPMPPRRRTTRAQTARAVRDNVDEHEQPAVPPPAAPPVDQDALRQMVQDAARQAAQEALQQIAQEAARQAAQEAARVAAQEVARQMAAVQQGPQIQVQQVPLVQVQQDQQIPAQHDHQDPVQQVPLPQVPLQQGPVQQFAHGVQDLPPPPPRPHVYPVYNERFYRLTCQMRNMEMEHFSGTVDAVAAHDWKLALQRKLEIIECPPELSLRLTMQYLRGDALIWWEGIRLSHFGPERLTFADFIREFDRKYFPKEAMDRKKCEFEHVSQGVMSIREYEVVFNQLRRFAGVGISEEDLIRKF
ncbi:lysine-specific demethylase 9-like [Brassica napus]|uniref:lysine-specific demethylase 9-like n=1 Tax=Brassica napus TaxID=3708 RepID=UPI002078F3D9|nr:lysine-specific demethylase 9-like [Brassica napus]